MLLPHVKWPTHSYQETGCGYFWEEGIFLPTTRCMESHDLAQARWLLLSSVMLLSFNRVFNCWSLCPPLVPSNVPTCTGLQGLPPPTCTTSSPHLWGTLWECLLLSMAESWDMHRGLGTVHFSSVQSKESSPKGWPLLLLSHASHQPLFSLPASSYMSVILKS